MSELTSAQQCYVLAGFLWFICMLVSVGLQFIGGRHDTHMNRWSNQFLLFAFTASGIMIFIARFFPSH